RAEHRDGGGGDREGKGEGGNRNHRLVDIPAIAASQLIPQLDGLEVGGIEHDVSSIPKRRREVPLSGNSVLGGAVRRERMKAASLVVAPHQLRRGTVEIEDFSFD